MRGHFSGPATVSPSALFQRYLRDSFAVSDAPDLWSFQSFCLLCFYFKLFQGN